MARDPSGEASAAPWAELVVAGSGHRLRRLDVIEGLSIPFRCRAQGLCADMPGVPLASGYDLTGEEALVRWGCGGEQRRLAGVVTRHCLVPLGRVDRPGVEVVVEPRLVLLRHGQAGRLLTGMAPEAMTRSWLESIGYAPEQVLWRTEAPIPEHRQILQPAESDLTLLRRLWARCGVAYLWLDGERERLCLTDTPAGHPRVADPVVLPGEGDADGAPTEVLGWERRRERLPEPWGPRAGELSEDARRLERLRAEAREAQSRRLRLSLRSVRLGGGRRFKVCGHRDGEDDPWGAWHVVTRAHHQLDLDEDPSSGRPRGLAWSVAVDARPEWYAARPRYPRPVEPTPASLPAAATAIVDTGGRAGDPTVGPTCRVRSQAGPDPSGELSRLVPARGPEPAAGWHAPLYDGDRVVVAGLAQDPHTPLILGVLPGREAADPAAVTRGRDGAYRTRGGQGLLWAGAGAAAMAALGSTLHAAAEQTALTMERAPDKPRDRVRLQSAGSLELSDGSRGSERCSADRHDRVGRDDHLRVVGDIGASASQIAVRCAHGGRLVAGEGLTHRAAGTAELAAQAGMHGLAGEGVRLWLRGGEGTWRVDAGGLRLTAAQRIRIDSRHASATLRNGSGTAGLTIHASGGVRLWGERIVLAAETLLRLSGTIRHEPG